MSPQLFPKEQSTMPLKKSLLLAFSLFLLSLAIPSTTGSSPNNHSIAGAVTDLAGEPMTHDETGELDMSEWSNVFSPTDEHGHALAPETLPLTIALKDRRPAHGRLWIHGLDKVPRHIEVTALPLIGQANRFLGAAAIFWTSA